VENEIHSPPYPTGSASPERLFEHLAELITWTVEHQDWANEEFEARGAPEDAFVRFEPNSHINREAFLRTSVRDMYTTWSVMRAIREKYDSIVRNYEDAEEWSSDTAVFFRIQLVKAASLLLAVAFLDSEKREAKTMEMMDATRKEAIKLMKKQLSSLKQLFDSEGEDDDNEIDYDRLFNPESN
jgi:hypothetical protein